MEIIQVVGIGLIAALLSVLIKQYRPEIAMALPMLGATAIFLIIFPYLRITLDMFDDIANRVGVESQYMKIILKIIGVSYVCQFASELCKDAGEIALAGRIEFAGKIIILAFSMPVIYRLLEVVSKIINF